MKLAWSSSDECHTYFLISGFLKQILNRLIWKQG